MKKGMASRMDCLATFKIIEKIIESEIEEESLCEIRKKAINSKKSKSVTPEAKVAALKILQKINIF